MQEKSDISKNILDIIFLLYFITIPLLETKIHNVTINIFLSLLFLGYFACVIFIKSERHIFFKSIKDALKDPLFFIMLIFSVLMLVSITYSVEKSLARSESLRFISYIGIFFVVKYRLLDNERKIKLTFKIYFLEAFFISLYGIFQYFTKFNLSKDYINTLGGKTRITAVFDNPNAYGAYLILAIFPVLIFILKDKKIKHKICYLLFSVLLVLNITFTDSRNAYLALALGIILCVLFFDKRLIVLAGILGIIAFKVPLIHKRILAFEDPEQNIQRFKLWKTALKVIHDHFIFGVGNGNFVSVYDKYVKKYPELSYRDYSRYPTHNLYLKVFSELGIIGLVCFCILILFVVIYMYKSYKKCKNQFIKSFLEGFLISIIAFMIMNTFDNLLVVPKVASYFWIMVAIGSKVNSISQE